MQIAQDPNLAVMRREQRGLDVNDITGKRSKGSLPPQQYERVAAVKPRQMNYDIINPSPSERLRMSAYGKNILDSQQQARTTKITGSPAAGKKMMPKSGEANVDQIWPADSQLKAVYDDRNGRLQTHDINLNKQNPRMMRVKEQDNMMIREFLAAKQQASASSSRPYKNNSNVFTHLIDDPSTRQKIAQNNSSMSRREPDVLDRMMQQVGAPVMNNAAAMEYGADPMNPIGYQGGMQPVDLTVNGGAQAQAMGAVNNSEVPKGKRAFQKGMLSVNEGQMRLFGNENNGAVLTQPAEAARRGKKIMGLPSQPDAGTQKIF